MFVRLSRSTTFAWCGCAGDLVGQRVALDFQEASAAASVVPELTMRSARIVAEIDVIRERGLAGIRRRTADRGVARVGELDVVARAAPGALDQQHHPCLLMRIGCRSSAALVDHRSAREAVE